ncbi:MAG: hypothetical protein QF886_16490, partial [Planctomycetota bacterium]|nr:hypothetical protein [Planctomycetota bacterium]
LIESLCQSEKPADEGLLKIILGFPEDLPDLSSRRPPDGNSRPDGIHNSYYEQRKRGVLPNRY